MIFYAGIFNQELPYSAHSLDHNCCRSHIRAHVTSPVLSLAKESQLHPQLKPHLSTSLTRIRWVLHSQIHKSERLRRISEAGGESAERAEHSRDQHQSHRGPTLL